MDSVRKPSYTLTIDGITVDVQDNNWKMGSEAPYHGDSKFTATIYLDMPEARLLIDKLRSDSIYDKGFKLIACSGPKETIFLGKIRYVADLNVEVEYNTPTATFTIFTNEAEILHRDIRFRNEKRYDIFGKRVRTI